ncbi:hypothetical protein LJC14_00595 [Treponema sp. OttesenSCG-928-L16]|nr:hypothetical protein [Treponema sp. OttesenSCG-928-L16]
MNPVKEQYFGFTRVILKGIPSSEMVTYLTKVKQTGFNEVIIREDDNAANTISEKWEISSPESDYSSFEFNHDNHYVAVENNDAGLSHFGEYSMPQKNIIYLENLGTLTITEDNAAGVSFSFSPINEEGREMKLEAVKAETITESPELDLFCRTWQVVNSTEKDFIGFLLFISNAGTYFFTEPEGQSNSLSSWRWHDDKKEEFEYSHDDWEYYGRAEILELTQDSLEVFDPGYSTLIPGYSAADLNNYWELVPIKQ